MWSDNYIDQISEICRNPHGQSILLTGPEGLELLSLFKSSYISVTGKPIESDPDSFIVDIDPESKTDSISIDQVRKLIEFSHLTPSGKNLRFLIINNADRMNKSASNSLLKTLEEPGYNTIILLITGRPEKLLPTIVSRCQKQVLPAFSEDQFVQYLNTSKFENPVSLSILSGRQPWLAHMLHNGAMNSYKGALGLIARGVPFDRSKLWNAGKANKETFLINISGISLVFYRALLLNTRVAYEEAFPGERKALGVILDKYGNASMGVAYDKVQELAKNVLSSNLDPGLSSSRILIEVEKILQ